MKDQKNPSLVDKSQRQPSSKFFEKPISNPEVDNFKIFEVIKKLVFFIYFYSALKFLKQKYEVNQNELFKQSNRIFSKNFLMSPNLVRITSNLIVAIALAVFGIGLFLIISYAYSTKSLKTNMESCHSDTECCCGQYCLNYRKYFTCQCKPDRWWNSAISYCRKLN